MAPVFRRLLRAALSALVPLGLAACVAPCDYGQGDVLPLTLRGPLPFVPVEVNGHRAPFLLDTGASYTTLMPEGVSVLRLQTDRLRSSRATGVGGESRERNALLSRLRVGKHELRNLTLPVASHTLPGQRIAGVLGADLLRITEVELDIPARRVALHDRRACRISALPWQGAYDTIPFQLVSGLVVVPAEVNGQPVRALFDTGASGTGLRRSLAPAISITEEELARLPAVPVHGIGTQAGELRLHRGATLRLGEETVEGLTLGILDLPAELPFDLILGQDYIGPRRFWLSYAEQRLYVQKPAPLGP